MKKKIRKIVFFSLVVIFILVTFLLKRQYNNEKKEFKSNKIELKGPYAMYFQAKIKALTINSENTYNLEDNEVISLVIEYKREYGKEALIIVKDSIIDIISSVDPILNNAFQIEETKPYAIEILDVLKEHNSIFFNNPIKAIQLMNEDKTDSSIKIYIALANNSRYLHCIKKGDNNTALNKVLLERITNLAGIINNDSLSVNYFFYE